MIHNDKSSFRTFELGSGVTALGDRIQMSALFSMMQDVAVADAGVRNIGEAALDSHDIGWMLMRISIRLHRIPQMNETITVETWNRGAKSLTFRRDFRFRMGNSQTTGQTFAEASSDWVLVNTVTRRLVRRIPHDIVPQDSIQNRFDAVFDFSPPRLKPLGTDETTNPAVMTVNAEYTHIDRNRHVNNRCYIDWGLDALARAKGRTENLLPELLPKAIDINYLHEVHWQDTLAVYCVQSKEHPEEYILEGILQNNNLPAFRMNVCL